MLSIFPAIAQLLPYESLVIIQGYFANLVKDNLAGHIPPFHKHEPSSGSGLVLVSFHSWFNKRTF